MSTTPLSRAELLFDELADLAGPDRDVRLASLATSDPEAHHILVRLLKSDSAAADFLATPAIATIAPAQPPQTPTRIGRYEVVRLIGQGGMGSVYEATQDSPRRSVAVKVIRESLASPELLARFRRETQLLGTLRHPGIAAIYEAGVADLTFATHVLPSQPFFAMELVRGPSLAEYRRTTHLSAGDSLRLFCLICDAVEHAHAHGVVHRDLKPGNILIDLDSGPSPQPKILDFGVARSTLPNNPSTLHTDAMQLVGTVSYMSPEQIAPARHAGVDARSDVYALGVILYELLTGRQPHDLRDRSFVEAARIVTSEEPAPPSSTVAALRGDLDTILLTALEKDPARRYQSAAALARDIRSHLDDQPIHARPATNWYLITKFARRNRVLVASLIAIFAILASTTAVSLRLYLQAQAARDQAVALATKEELATKEAARSLELAERESRKLEAVNTYLLNDFIRAADPAKDGPDVKLLDVLMRAAENVDARFPDDPSLAGAIHTNIADAFGNIDMRDRAIAHARLAVERTSAGDGPTSEAALSAHHKLVAELIADQKHAEAEGVARAALAQFDGHIPPTTANILRIRLLLTECIQAQGRYTEAEPLVRAALADAEQALGRTSPVVLAGYATLSAIFQATNRANEALDLQLDLLERRRHTTESEMFGVLILQNNLVNALSKAGRHGDALKVARELVLAARSKLPSPHVMRGRLLMSAGQGIHAAGFSEEAVPILVDAYENLFTALGISYPLEICASHVRNAHRALSNSELTREWSVRAFAIRLVIAGDDEHESLSVGMSRLQQTLAPLFPDAFAASLLGDELNRLTPWGHARRARAFVNLARSCLAMGDFLGTDIALRTATEALFSSPEYDVDRRLINAIRRLLEKFSQ